MNLYLRWLDKIWAIFPQHWVQTVSVQLMLGHRQCRVEREGEGPNGEWYKAETRHQYQQDVQQQHRVHQHLQQIRGRLHLVGEEGHCGHKQWRAGKQRVIFLAGLTLCTRNPLVWSPLTNGWPTVWSISPPRLQLWDCMLNPNKRFTRNYLFFMFFFAVLARVGWCCSLSIHISEGLSIVSCKYILVGLPDC